MNYKEIADKYQSNFKYPIILIKHKNKIHELTDEINTTINENDLEFITLKDKLGFDTYIRSVQFLMIKSFYKVVGKENIDSLIIQFSLGDSFYVEAKGNFVLNQELLNKVIKKMKDIVNKNIPITKKTINKEDAIELFKEYKMYEKEKLFKYRRVSNITLYSMGHFDDYFYGDMVYSTNILKYFDLKIYDEGFLLLVPNIKNPTKITPIPQLDKLYKVLKESTIWSEKIGIKTVGDLNNAIVNKNINDIILLQEAKMEKQIGAIAEQILENKKTFVMIAGPSSSGKTSFSNRLCIQLRSLGLNPHLISVDDYFINRADIKPNKNNEIDLESIDIVDIEKFNKDMISLLNKETIELPSFNFVKGEREYKGNYLTLQDNDILVIEGIHCLNNKMSYALDDKDKFRIYISALTPLNIDEHNRISSSDLRLIRRISRDARNRGANACNTINSWKSVREGEMKNIFPYQQNADIIFNSSLIYELVVLKEIVEPLLFKVDTPIEYIEAKRLLKFLDYFLAYNDKTIPINSLLKEFSGGSYFNV